MVDIIKNAAAPLNKRGRSTKYPFEALGINDGFDVNSEGDINKMRRIVYSAAYAYKRKADNAFDFVIGISPDSPDAVRLVRVA